MHRSTLPQDSAEEWNSLMEAWPSVAELSSLRRKMGYQTPLLPGLRRYLETLSESTLWKDFEREKAQGKYGL